MTQRSVVDIKELNNKRRFFHQAHGAFNKLEHDYQSPGDVLATSPEGMIFDVGEVWTDPLEDHISGHESKFGIGIEEITSPFFEDIGSYPDTTVIHVPRHSGHIPETNRRRTFISYLKNEGEEAIVESIRQFFDLKHQDPSEPSSIIESLRPLPTFLGQELSPFRLIAGSDPEQLMELVWHIQGDDTPDSIGSMGDAFASFMPLIDVPPLQEHSNIGIAVFVDSSGHTQVLGDILAVLDPMKPTIATTEVLHRTSSSISGVWRDYPKPTQNTKSSVRSEERARLFDDLRTAFRQEPFEDGVEHEAEQIIGNALSEVYTLPWLRKFSTDEYDPVFAASVLGCLGRQINPGSKSWRIGLIRTALTINNIEVRDAAVVAAHLWGDKELARVLTSHQESVPWLHDYIQVVVHALEE